MCSYTSIYMLKYDIWLNSPVTVKMFSDIILLKLYDLNKSGNVKQYTRNVNAMYMLQLVFCTCKQFFAMSNCPRIHLMPYEQMQMLNIQKAIYSYVLFIFFFFCQRKYHYEVLDQSIYKENVICFQILKTNTHVYVNE